MPGGDRTAGGDGGGCAARIIRPALALLFELRAPLVGPSANPERGALPDYCRHVRESFGAEEVLVLDGGACAAGIEIDGAGCDERAAADPAAGGDRGHVIADVLGRRLKSTVVCSKRPGCLRGVGEPGNAGLPLLRCARGPCWSKGRNLRGCSRTMRTRRSS